MDFDYLRPKYLVTLFELQKLHSVSVYCNGKVVMNGITNLKGDSCGLYIDIRLNELRNPIGEFDSPTYDPGTSQVSISQSVL